MRSLRAWWAAPSLALLLCLALPASALAQAFSTASTASAVGTTVTTTSNYDFTDATSTLTNYDASGCTTLTAAFDASTGDTSTDARISLMSCPAADSTNPDCVAYAVPNTQFTARPVNVPKDKAFVRVRLLTSPAGGDTGRVQLVCASPSSVATTTLGGGFNAKEANVQVGDADIVNLDFGAGFDITESPNTEINVVVDVGEVASGGALSLTYGGTGANTSAYEGLIGVTGGAAVQVASKGALETAVGVTNFALADGDTYTGVQDFGAADSFEIPNGTSGTTDADGEVLLDTNCDGTNVTGPCVQMDSGASQKYLFPAALPLAASQDNYILKYDASGKTVQWEADVGAGAGAFDDSGDPIVMTTTTKDVQIGAAQINTAKLSVDGDADQVQFALQGHSTQTSNLVELENSAGAIVFSISNTGAVVGAGGFTATSTASPCVTLDDSDSASETVDAQLCAQATDTGNGTEDVDVTINTQVNSTLTSRITIDADDETRLSGGYVHVGVSGSPGVATADGDLYVLDDLEVDDAVNIAGAVTLGTALTVANGGTGATTLTSGGFLYGTGTSAITASAVMTEGQLAIGDGTTVPTISTVGGDATLASNGTLTLAAGAIDAVTIAAAGIRTGADLKFATGTAGANGDCAQWNVDGDLVTAGSSCASGTGDSVSVDAGAVVDPNLASTGDIDVVNTSNTVTFNLNANVIVAADHANADWGDGTFASSVFTIDANAITAAKISTFTAYMNWQAGAFVTDGTNCTGPTASVIVTSSAKQYSVVCNDGGTFYGTGSLPPDIDDTADVTFSIFIIRHTGSTALAGDFSYQCYSDDAAVGSTWNTGASADKTLTTADDLYISTTSGIDIETPCAAGDFFNWRYVIDDANHNASAANIVNVRMSYVKNPA